MKTVLCIFLLGIMVGFTGVQSGLCESKYVNGVELDEFGLPVSIDSIRAPLDESNLIDFSPPCVFAQALPASKYPYKHLGFSFKGNGAVLNECGNFFVTGYSPPNFLAFNCTSTLANGKIPSLPETITFKPPVSAVSFRIGSSESAGQVVTATINKKYPTNITLANDMPQYLAMSMEGPIIKTLSFTVPQGSSACLVVIDDIQTSP